MGRGIAERFLAEAARADRPLSDSRVAVSLTYVTSGNERPGLAGRPLDARR